MDEFYWVPMVLLARALKHQKAIMCLARERFAADAAIVGLTQFELCLDILYISLDRTRATAWIEHQSETRQPWSVKHKINEVYAADPQMCDGNHGAFQNMSQIKHANPLAGPYGFPWRVSGFNMRIETNPDPHDLLRVWSVIVLLFSSHKLLEAGVAVKRCHSEFVRFDESVDDDLASLLAECRNLVTRNIPRPASSSTGAVH